MNHCQIASFYLFVDLSEQQLVALREQAFSLAPVEDVRGLIVCGREGINGTISGRPVAVEKFLELIARHVGVPFIERKISWSAKHPYARFKIDTRREIITSKEDLGNEKPPAESYLEPAEWDKMMAEPDVVVVDTRNTYETELGMFKGAIDPKIEKFSDFQKYIDASALPKDKKIMLYCTGGIRCEKAVVEMRQRGYEHVYQLHGGILKYLEELPNKNYDGECFVFDHRVAVDQELAPSKKYRLCPHCGNPGQLKITCQKCSKEAVVCDLCNPKPYKSTCSKNCANHLKRVAETRQARLSPTASAKSL